MSALAQLEKLRGEVGALRARVADLDRARGEGARKVQVAREALLDYHREREAGGLDVDASEVAREAELVEALVQAENGLTVRVVSKFGGGGMEPDLDLEPVDELAEARLAGAQEALQAAEDRLREFASANLDDLQVERTPRAAAARAALIEADRMYRLAAQTMQAELTWQTQLANDANRPDLIGTLPSNPGAWIAQAPREVPLPLPETYRL